MSKVIELTQGHVAIVDDEDYELLNQYVWYADRSGNTFYACRKTPDGKYVPMHKQILPTTHGHTPDHINGWGLDNRKSNLRPATRQQQAINSRKRRRCSSIYKGVTHVKDSPTKPWRVWLTVNGKAKFKGRYATEEEAARAYDSFASELYGEFAYLNFPDRDSNHKVCTGEAKPEPATASVGK